MLYPIIIPYIRPIIVIPYHQCLSPPLTSHTQRTIFQFIRRPKFSSNIVTHNHPSVEQSKFCYHTQYILLNLSPQIRIPYIRSIIVTPHHQFLFLFTPPSPPTYSRPYSSSSVKLISVQLSSPIVPHQKSSVNVSHTQFILIILSLYIRILYIRWIIVTLYHQCLFCFINFTSPHRRPYSSSSVDLTSVQKTSPVHPP